MKARFYQDIMGAVLQARRYFVRGRVQGVGYRWFVQENATTLRMSGYARNLDDGRVEVYAIGTPEQLNELCSLLWRGPRMSDVRAVDEQHAALERLSGFRITG